MKLIEYSRHSISRSLLREMSEFYYVDNCLICDSKLTIKEYGADILIKCSNECYQSYISPLFTTVKDITWEVRVFEHTFHFYDHITYKDKVNMKNHVYFDNRYYYSVKKRVESLVRFYKYNDRYLMKLLLR